MSATDWASQDYEITKKGEDYVDNFISNFVDDGYRVLREHVNPNQSRFDIFKFLWKLRETGDVRTFIKEVRKTRSGFWKARQLVEWALEKELVTSTSKPRRRLEVDRYYDSPEGRRREEMWDQYSEEAREAALRQNLQMIPREEEFGNE